MIPTIYNFRYPEVPGGLIMPEYIGLSRVADVHYSWDGRCRQERSVLFQYTLSGCGRLEVDGRSYTMAPGLGMLLTFPENHVYAFDPDLSDHWEFLWLQAVGARTFPCWQEWRADTGPVLAMDRATAPIRLLLDLYEQAGTGRIRDKYELSEAAYRWCLAMYRHLERGDRAVHAPDAVEAAKRYMNANFHRPMLTLADIADSAGLSRTYFSTLFRQAVGMTPMAYLLRRRLEEAIRLLKYGKEPLAAVAARTGFDNAGYFGKVFRRHLGVTPGAYRLSGGDSSSAAFSDIIYAE